jgi:two-component system CheB/CheR fusion protein
VTEGLLLHHLGNEQGNVPKLRELLEEGLPESKQAKDFAVTHDFLEMGRKTMLVSGRRVEDVSADGPAMILLSVEDIAERVQAKTTALEGIQISLGDIGCGIPCRI